MGAVSRAEGIVHVDVAVSSELLGELGVVISFTGVETHIFEKKDFTVVEISNSGLDVGANAIINELHARRDQFAEAIGSWLDRERRILFTLGTTEVRHENDTTTGIDEMFYGRDGRLDAGVVSDVAFVIERHVEIHAHKNALTGRIDVADREFHLKVFFLFLIFFIFKGPNHVLSPTEKKRPPTVQSGALLSKGSLWETTLEAAANEFHGVDRTVGVTPLVVVPADNLDEITLSHCRVGVEDTGVRIAHDVLEDERIFAVVENSLKRTFSSFFVSSVDFFNSRFLLENRAEVSHRTSRRGNAESAALKLTVQLRDHEADRFGGTRAARNDVLSSGTSAAEVTVRSVEHALVTRVRVDRAHETLLNTESIVEDFHHRRQAVGGAGSVGNNVVLCRIVEVVVDADAESKIRFLSRSGDDHLLSASFDVLAGSGAVHEETGGFENYVHAFIAPGECSRIALSSSENAVTVNRDRLVVVLDGAVEATSSGVILKQVCERLVVSQVVDCNDFPELFLGHGAQNVAANPSKSVNSVGCHFGNSSVFRLSRPGDLYPDGWPQLSAESAPIVGRNSPPSKEKPLPKPIH